MKGLFAKLGAGDSAEERRSSAPAESDARNHVVFATGVLTGVAVAALVPWHFLEKASPALRIGAAVALCAACLLFRIALQNKTMRRVGGFFGIVAGGFLMASSPYLGSTELTMTLVATGSTAFLCGLALLLRDRQPTRAEREGAIQRLLEVEPAASAEPTSQIMEMPLDEGERWTDDVLALVTAIGVRPSAPYAETQRQEEEAKRLIG